MYSEELRTVVLTPPFDIAEASTHTVFNMGKAHKATIFIAAGNMTTDGCLFTLKCGAAANDVDTNVYDTATPNIKRTNAAIEAADGDLFTNDVELESNEDYFKILTTDKRLYRIELNASELPADKPWVKLQIGNEGTTENLVCAWALLHMRYAVDGTVIGS